MREIIKNSGSRLTVSSIVIAEQFGRQHKTVIRSIESLIESGHIAGHEFVPGSYTDKNNQQRKCYDLTEDGFLIAMPFIGGKKAKDGQRALVKAFSKYRRLAECRASLEWQQMRSQGKISRRQETDTIQSFVEYATAQGSNHADHYYQNITKTTYKSLFLVNGKMTELREKLNPVQLSILATAEYVANQALREGMNKGMPYKDVYTFTRDRLALLGNAVGQTALLRAE